MGGEMNAKIIAERLRRLAKYEIPSQPFTSRELKGIITDIADELDPPEPKPMLAGRSKVLKLGER